MRHRNWLLLCGLILLGVTRCAESRSDDELKPVPDPISDKLIEIRLPYEPVLVQPDEVQPAPSPIDVSPQPVDTLAADQWYVIESSVPLIVLSSPDGFVGIDPSEGPIRVRGKFADGTGKVETRTFLQPHVYFVNAKQAGKIELIVIPQGVTEEDDIIRQPITVMGLAPIPPPGPGPGPDVDPVPPGPPVGLRVLILGNEDASREQLNTMNSTEIVAWLNDNCAKSDDGRAEWRRWDRTSVSKPGMLDKETHVWQKLWAAVKDGLPDGPTIIAVTDQKVTVQPMAGPAETLTLLTTIKAGN